MSSNIEKFLLQFEFVDKGTVKRLKELNKLMDGQTKKTKQNAAQQAQSSKKVASAVGKQEKAFKNARAALNGLIVSAKKMHIDTSFFERSIAASKKAETLQLRAAQLRDKINAKKRTDYQLQQKILATEKATVEAIKKQGNARRGVSGQDKFRARTSNSEFFTTASKQDSVAAVKLLNQATRTYNSTKREEVALHYRSLRQLRNMAKQYNRTKREALSLHSVQRRLNDSTRNLLHQYISVFAVIGATTSINRVGQQFEALDSAMLAAMGTQKKAGDQMKFLDDLTGRLGLSLIDTADAYTKLAFSAKGKMSTDQIQELFTGMTEFGTVMGVSKERMKWSMTAINQMVNKSTLSMEELKRQ